MKQLSLLLFSLFFFTSIEATPAPNFTVTTSDDQAFNLYQQYINQGKLVLVEAFFTSCPPCAAHAPLLQTLYTQMLADYPGRVEFILLSTLSTDTNVKVAQYKTSKNLTMPAAGANGGSITALQPYTSGQFGDFLGTPTFIIIAPGTGEVHYDIRGNSASQTINLLKQKIMELLPPIPPAPVFCDLKDPFGNSLSDVSVEITAPGFDTTFTANGSYSLSNVAALANKTYTINPDKPGNPLDGLTTYDLVLISKHILGIESFQCDWQRLAADVNCSGSITTLDIVTARKVLLGIDQDLPCGSWRFAPDSSVASNGGCTAFLACKIADVNSQPCVTVAPVATARSSRLLELPNRRVAAGTVITVPVYVSESSVTEGFQLGWQYDPAQFDIVSISTPALPGFQSDNLHLARGMARVSWSHAAGQPLTADTPVLLVTLAVHQSGLLSDLWTVSEAWLPEWYEASEGPQTLDLRWMPRSGEADTQPSFEVFPNPTTGRFTLSATMAQSRDCRIQLLDGTGRVVLESNVMASAGDNQWTIDAGQVPNGLYGIQLDGVLAGKIMVQR
jgi:thiol-disulfide isomerase/thioredoxin